jgi:hypothetical protein
MNLILAIVLIWVAFSLGVFFCMGWAIMKKRKEEYNGVINITVTEDKTLYSLELNHPVEDLQDMDQAIFKIKPLVDPIA